MDTGFSSQLACSYHLLQEYVRSVLRIAVFGIREVFMMARHTSKPIRSPSSRGPIGWFAPSFMAVSMFRGISQGIYRFHCPLDLPYLFQSNEAAEEVLDGSGTGNIQQSGTRRLQRDDMDGPCWRQLTANKEIPKPEDMKD